MRKNKKIIRITQNNITNISDINATFNETLKKKNFRKFTRREIQMQIIKAKNFAIAMGETDKIERKRNGQRMIENFFIKLEIICWV